MAQNPDVDPSAFFLEGGSKGVLLLHGFTGSPPEMRLIGEHLHAEGWTVKAPLLPGHGTSYEDLNRCRWQDWFEAAQAAYDELKEVCDPVFVGGLSMGSMLTVHLAARNPEIPGFILYASPLWLLDWRVPYTGIGKYFFKGVTKNDTESVLNPDHLKYLWSYSFNPMAAGHEVWKLVVATRKLLPHIKQPALLFEAAHDKTVSPLSGRRTLDALGSTQKTLHHMDQSAHCLTVDQQWPEVAKLTSDFLNDLTSDI